MKQAGKAALGSRKSCAGVKLGFRFSTELQTAARKTQPKRIQLNRGGTSAPLDDELGRPEVRVVFARATLRFKVPGAFLRFDTVKTESKSLE